MAGTYSASGLRCSHGSDLDTTIPRARLPKTALPPELRARMGLTPRREEDASKSQFYTPGNGVLQAAGSAPDGGFLKGGSGVPASVRLSGLARDDGGAEHLARVAKTRPPDKAHSEALRRRASSAAASSKRPSHAPSGSFRRPSQADRRPSQEAAVGAGRPSPRGSKPATVPAPSTSGASAMDCWRSKFNRPQPVARDRDPGTIPQQAAAINRPPQLGRGAPPPPVPLPDRGAPSMPTVYAPSAPSLRAGGPRQRPRGR